MIISIYCEDCDREIGDGLITPHDSLILNYNGEVSFHTGQGHFVLVRFKEYSKSEAVLESQSLDKWIRVDDKKKQVKGKERKRRHG